MIGGWRELGQMNFLIQFNVATYDVYKILNIITNLKE